MRQPRPKMIAGTGQENLRLVFKPPKRTRVNDPRAITLEFGPISMALLRIFSATRVAGLLRERRERGALGRLHCLARFPAVLHHRIICSMSILPRLIFRATRAPLAVLATAGPAGRRVRATAR